MQEALKASMEKPEKEAAPAEKKEAAKAADIYAGPLQTRAKNDSE